MSTNGRPSNLNQSSIKYRFVLLEGESFKLANVGQRQDQLNTSSSPGSRGSEKSMSKISTTRLLSTVGNVWQHFFLPSTFHPEAKRGHSGSKSSIDNKGLKLTNIGCLLSERTSVEIANRQSKISQRGLLFDPLCGHVKNLSAWTGNSCFATDFCRTGALGIFYGLESIYEPIFKSLLPEIVKKKSYPDVCQITSKSMTRSLSFGTNSSELMSSESTSLSHDAIVEVASGTDEIDAAETRKKPYDSLQSSYLLGLTHSVDNEMCMSTRTFKSTLYSDYCLDFVSVNSCVSGAESFCINADNLDQGCEVVDKNNHEHQVKEVKSFFFENLSMTNMWCHMHGKALDVFAKHRYAIAGAMAGVFVSLCLHPFDTVKTVLQARALDQSVYRVAESILAERGVMGLYRGIASNIASSAPISGVYAYTYESIKSLLLPLFPKEHHSFVYCMAGGCASIATSFIFTPSERIKQQMQVRALYSSCWNALIGVFEKGGLISLYTGWGAVLCRNIPHSIIKFYTYEKLKKLMKFPAESIGHSDTLYTLICGGLAGSTAAFFTTPFDVVKTKLQTQIPGSHLQYKGVLQVLSEVAMNEGLRGLYRGLTPRLVMYVSQGALFFASYEFFKSVFSTEAPIF